MYEELEHLEEEFDDYAAECKAALRLTEARLVNLKEAMDRKYGRPVFTMTSRIKTFGSTIEKCKQKGSDTTIANIKEIIRDIAGIRIVTTFKDEIDVVTEAIRHVPGIILAQEKDYVNNPKPNGYKSLHIHVLVEIYSPIKESSILIPVEIQVRDKAMDLWAATEHVVKYKNDYATPEMDRLFKNMSDNLALFDENAMKLRDYRPDPDECQDEL